MALTVSIFGHIKRYQITKVPSTLILACVAGVQRGGRGEVEFEREARSLRAPNDRAFVALSSRSRRASRSHSTSPPSPLYAGHAGYTNPEHDIMFRIHYDFHTVFKKIKLFFFKIAKFNTRAKIKIAKFSTNKCRCER